MADPLAIEWLPIDSIQVRKENPKRHDLRQIEESIRRFGFVQPLIVDKTTGTLIAGHGRLQVIKKMMKEGKICPGLVGDNGVPWKVPVVRVALKSEREAKAYLIADNRLTEKGGWDEASLGAMVRDLAKEKDGLRGIGLSKLEASRLMGKFGESFTEASAKGYVTSSIRQITLYYSFQEFQAYISRMEKAMAQAGVKNHTELFKALLADWEKKHANHRSQAKK